MILIDYSQVAIAGMMQFQNDLKHGSDEKIVGLIRHVVLSSLLANKKKFGSKYGDMVIACDGKNYWRKEIFPYYKASRSKNRDKSDINWKLIFDTLSKIRDELEETFPYKVVNVEAAEADDVIGVLTSWLQDNELKQQGLEEEPQPVLIVTSDQDNLQLQQYRNVVQYSPMQKKFVKPQLGAKQSLIEKICCGDSGDGIPNIMSSDDVFVTGSRQKPFKKSRLEEFYALGVNACKNDDERRNFQRNELLVSYAMIPDNIKTRIIDTYITKKPSSNKMKIMEYLVKNKCKNLLENIEEF